MVTDEKTRYIGTVGRRKTAIARVRLTPAAKSSCTVNDKDVDAYFPTAELRATAIEAITTTKLPVKFKITAKIIGGGINGQAEALRHGIARALIIHDIELRKKVKAAGFLKRDPRAKERRKFGLKKARKAPQWSKR
ncbi:MAG: 30S ribosomal protein S9 [Parcubacteria group bacterium GW2011_GWA2_47_16]|nr:MAG: 30S ribosomal protein S9 [Parcubacteria group bacterium GW2011_GWA2_47_16]